MSLEPRIAALEAVRQEQSGQWSQLLLTVTNTSFQLQEIAKQVAVIQSTLDTKILTLDSDLSDIEAKVDKLPAKALGASSLLIGIMVGIGQLAGVIKF